jgi:hypothetical protein
LETASGWMDIWGKSSRACKQDFGSGLGKKVVWMKNLYTTSGG